MKWTAASIALLACNAEIRPLANVSAGPAEVRLVNLLPGPVTVDIELDGAPLFDDVGFTHATDRAPVMPGEHHLAVGGRSMAIELSSGVRYTVVANEWGAIVLEEEKGARFVHAARFGRIEAALIGGGERIDLGAPMAGQRGPSVELEPGLARELAIVADDLSLSMTLPDLRGLTDLIAAATPEGDLFVLLLGEDGSTAQIGPPDHQGQIRFTNLSKELGLASLIVDGEALSEVPFLAGGEYVAMPPGTKVLEVAEPIRLGMRKGALYTAVAFDGVEGPRLMIVEDQADWDLGEETEVVIANAVGDLSPIDVYLDGARVHVALESGSVTDPIRRAVGEHVIGVDVDRDGHPEAAFLLHYLAEYRFDLFVCRDEGGRIILAGEPPAGGLWLPPPL